MSKLLSQNGNFRNLIFSNVFNNVASGIFGIFILWAIHAQYQNVIYTGIATAIFSVPMMLSFLIGPFVDRSSKAPIIRISRLAKLLIIAGLFVLQMTDAGVWVFFVSIALFSLAGAFSFPSSTALLREIVEGDELLAANSLSTILGTLTGLATGIVLFRLIDDFNNIYIIILGALLISVIFGLLIKSKAPANEGKTGIRTYFTQMREGASLLRRGLLLHLVSATLIFGVFGDIANALFPAFADYHTGSAVGYMGLMFASLIGGMAGPSISHRLGRRFTLPKILVFCLIVEGAIRVVFVYAMGAELRHGLVAFGLAAAIASTTGVFWQTMMQKLPPENMLGRLQTLRITLYSTAGVLGALAGGWLGTILEINTPFILWGASVIVMGLSLLLSRPFRNLPKVNELESIKLSD